MDIYKIITLVVIGMFYIAYFTKMFLQKKQGIKTNQLSKGDKPIKTKRIEKALSIATFIIVPVQIVSITLNTNNLGSISRIITGIIVTSIGVVIFIIAMYTMKNSWRAGISTTDKTTLIQSGIYRVSRNPAFLGFDLMYIGVFIAFPNIIHFIVILFTIIMMHLQIIEEEKYLPIIFGDEYLKYKDKTGRYFII